MKKIAFVCVHNSCRSQMAEGFSRVLGKGIIDAYSAGTERYKEVKPLAVEVMKEAGVDIGDQYPKLLSVLPADLDMVITMGCGVTCPSLPCRKREDWGLTDPSGGTINDFRKTRDLIEQKVRDLIERIKRGNI